MLSTTHPAASLFLYGLAAVVLPLIALPLLLAPLRWARVIGWRVPDDTDLTVYFGRCLGGVVTAMVLVVVLAAPHPEDNAMLFHLITAVGALMVVVHAWGAILRRQPLFETLETGLYAILAVASWMLVRGL
jgi:hypothetical protein